MPTPEVCIRLWAHEVLRVFGDRLTNDPDREWIATAVREAVRAPLAANFDQVFGGSDLRGLCFGDVLTPFGLSERPYDEIADKDKLQHACEEALSQYNLTSDKPMELALFGFAIEHLLRISRILKQPGGHALLVGVGGSGRQSLSRLASKMADMEVYSVNIKKNYRMQEWREDVKALMRQCGGKGLATSFLFTDSQIKEESFLEDVNNLLNTGDVPNLFPPEDVADIIEMVRAAAKSEGKAPDGTLQQLFSYFTERCRKNLHVVLCFSPIGESFRTRVTNFPSLVNCTTIDWFTAWPKDALEAVARRFLKDLDLSSELRDKCVEMVQYFHVSTKEAAAEVLVQMRHHYYVTPTSYLELISLFIKLLKSKREEINGLRNRY